VKDEKMSFCMNNLSPYSQAYNEIVSAKSIDCLLLKWNGILLRAESLSPQALSELREVYMDQYGLIETLNFGKKCNV